MKKIRLGLLAALLAAGAIWCATALAAPVARVLRFNREDRHIRGGDATRRKYLRQRAQEKLC